ncbi:MAG: hypothetical protein H7Z38_16255 [Rubrivivax sp.]|nr:hypothetical protein [Pyrinomonadaceae bacterium]
MSKQQSSKKRTQIKDIPREEKELNAGDMKKVKGGLGDTATHEVGHFKPNPTGGTKPKPFGFGGNTDDGPTFEAITPTTTK